MLKNAKNRCQAMPIERFRATTMAHVIEMITLINATTLTAHSQAGNQPPNQVEIGAAHAGYGSSPLADLNPRIPKMQIPIDRMISSTKYACAKFDPAKRDFRPTRRG